VPVPGHAGLRLKRLLIEKDQQRDVVLYWYQDRGRVITDEYTAKAYLLWDGFQWNRTDGALVRISAPVSTTPEEATERALRFVTDLWPVLEERLPGLARS
jgi:EpsI family protein